MIDKIPFEETQSVVETLENIVDTYKVFRDRYIYIDSEDLEQINGYNKRIKEYEDAINLIKKEKCDK